MTQYEEPTMWENEARVSSETMTSSPRPTWDETWAECARVFGQRSRCSRRRVGAVIVTADNEVAASSYNGPPAGLHLEGTCIDWCPRAQRYGNENVELDDLRHATSYASCPSIHAEANALLRADRTRINAGTIYASSAVCADCAKLVANSGLARVVMDVLPGDEHRNPDQVRQYLESCGLIVYVNDGERT